jgi:hypothetical protein
MINSSPKVAQIQCVWGLLASLSSIDQERNNISLFNIIDQLNIPAAAFPSDAAESKLPFFHFQHEIIMLWMRTLNTAISDEELSADCRIRLIDPRGRELQQTTAPLKLAARVRRMRFRMRTHGLAVSVPGDYIYSVEVGSQSAGDFSKVLEIPFEIVKMSDS